MNFYKNGIEHKSKLLIRGVLNGKEYKDKIDYGPTLYCLTQEHTVYKTLQSQFLKPIEFTNILSRAKVVEMKGIKPNEECRSFTGLYQDSQCMSTHHERAKFGLRSGEAESLNQKTV